MEAEPEVGMKTVNPQPHQVGRHFTQLSTLPAAAATWLLATSAQIESVSRKSEITKVEELTGTCSMIFLEIALITGLGLNGAVHAYFGDQQPKLF